MRYDYDVENECFVREDKLGKKIWINITEAQRIVTLHELGNTISQINNKINFQSGKVGESTVKNFLNNVEQGNIEIYGDYPAPIGVIQELSIEERLNNLEKDVELLKSNLCKCEDNKKLSERFKTWLKQ